MCGILMGFMHAETLRRFTAEEVLRMVEAGILAEDEPVELIDGALVAVSPQGPPHALCIGLVYDALLAVGLQASSIRAQLPVQASTDSMPEPDIAITTKARRELAERHPNGADLLLVVEISVTSQALDRLKAEVYARAQVPEYWQIDVPERCVTVYTEPVDGEYRALRILREGDDVHIGQAAIPVKDVLP